jgi:hypothetical protein
MHRELWQQAQHDGLMLVARLTMIPYMKALRLKSGLAALAMATLGGCVSYAQVDLASVSYASTRTGPYANIGTVVDAETKVAMKASTHDEPGRLAVRAEHPLLAELNCGEKLNGVGYVIASKNYKLNLEKNAQMSYAPMVEGEIGAKTCKILINIVAADGRYIQHEFDTEIQNTSGGDRVYSFKPVKTAADSSTTEEIPKPR